MLQFSTVAKFVIDKVADRQGIIFAETVSSILLNLYPTIFQSSWLMGFDGKLEYSPSPKFASEDDVFDTLVKD